MNTICALYIHIAFPVWSIYVDQSVLFFSSIYIYIFILLCLTYKKMIAFITRHLIKSWPFMIWGMVLSHFWNVLYYSCSNVNSVKYSEWLLKKKWSKWHENVNCIFWQANWIIYTTHNHSYDVLWFPYNHMRLVIMSFIDTVVFCWAFFISLYYKP